MKNGLDYDQGCLSSTQICPIHLYSLYNSKNVKNTDEGMLHLDQLDMFSFKYLFVQFPTNDISNFQFVGKNISII